jgi:TetR/AcrR family transcriptional regulator
METTEKTINDVILDATLEIIAQKKISGTRMHLIAEEAQTSQSNLHYHYPTKKDLLLAVLDRMQRHFTRKRMASVDLKHKGFSENLQALFEEKKDDILRHKKIDYAQFDYWVQGTVDRQIGDKFRRNYDIWRADIAQVLAQSGLPPEECDRRAETAPYLMVSIMMGASMQYLIDEGKFDLDGYFAAAQHMIESYYGCGADQATDDTGEGENHEQFG